MNGGRLAWTALAALALALGASAEVRQVVNVVNFMRGCEPRDPNQDLVKVLKEEVWLNRRYNLKNTILLQYDAMLRDDIMAAALESDPAATEFGVWFEVVKPLCDKLGVKWRGRADWGWDWHVCPGFLMSYSVADRERLCDEMMRLFKEKFGRLPESVGSWLIDAHSMAYMSGKYAVKAFCICREQDNTDAYGLRGGYSNGAYYPSKLNMLSPARDMANAIRTPVFRMLTPCPIYNYGQPLGLYADFRTRGCPTMEPVWYGGSSRDAVDWYFDTYLRKRGALNLVYMQTGQENGVEWERVALGLPYQLRKIAALQKEGKVAVETLAETARRFAKDHPANCPQTQVALSDWSGLGRKSVWYNSRFYRGNLMLDKGRLSVRDIHVMKDDFREPFFDTVCDGWKAEYFTPPFVDKWLDRGDSEKGGTEQGDMAFAGTFDALGVETPDDRTLVVTAVRDDGAVVKASFFEDRLQIDGASLFWEPNAARRKEVSFADGAFALEFRGYRYGVGVSGVVTPDKTGYRIEPSGGAIQFDFTP